MKKVITIIIFIILCIFVGLFIVDRVIKNQYSNNEYVLETYNGLPVNETSPLWMYNTSIPEKAVGAHQYVFVAKVNKILRTEYKNPIEFKIGLFRKEIITDPYTIYSISVLQNIKGELITSKEIELTQSGGISEDGTSYTFFEGVRLLKENEYYILMADTSKVEDSILYCTNPNGRIELGDEEEFKLNGGKIIEKYKEAYKNEYKYNIDNMISRYDVNYNKK